MPAGLLQIPVSGKSWDNDEEACEKEKHHNRSADGENASDGDSDFVLERDESEKCSARKRGPGERSRVKCVHQRDGDERASNDPMYVLHTPVPPPATYLSQNPAPIFCERYLIGSRPASPVLLSTSQYSLYSLYSLYYLSGYPGRSSEISVRNLTQC